MANEQQRDVRLRFGVTREGDTEAFGDVAEDIGGLDDRARAAAQSASKLIDDLGNVNPSDWHALEDAVQGVSKAIVEVGKAKGVEQQEKAVAGLKTATQGLGRVLSDAWTEGTDEAKRYQAVLDQIDSAQRDIADPLVQGYDRAREAVRKFEEAADKGTEEAASRGAEAAYQISRLADELERAKREGKDVGEIGPGLQQLSTRADKATESVVKLRVEKDRYNRTLAEGRTRVEGYGTAVRGLDDILLNFRDRGSGALKFIGKISLGIGGAVLVFREAYQAGRKLAEGIDFVAKGFFGVSNASDKAAGSINRWIGLTALANKIAGESGQLGLNQSKILDSQRTAYERLGIDLSKFTDDIRANQAQISAATSGNFEHARSIEAIAKGFGLLTDQQLAARAREVLFGISDLLKDGFDRARVAEAAKAQVQAILSELDRLPPGLRGNVKAMAETLGILSVELEKSAKDAEETAERSAAAAKAAAAAEREAAEDRKATMRSIADEFDRLLDHLSQRPEGGGTDSTRQELEALAEEKRKLDQQDVLDPEDLNRIDEINGRMSDLRQELQAAGDDVRSWGEATASASEAVDQAIGGVIEALRGRFGELSVEQQGQIEGILTNLQRLGVDGSATVTDVVAAVQQLTAVLDAAGQPTEALHGLLDQVQGRGLDVQRAFQGLRAEVSALSTDVSAAGSAVQQAGSAIAEGAAAVEGASVGVEKAGGKWRVFSEDAQESAVKIRRAGEDAEATSLSLERSGSNLEEAGAQMRGAGEAARAAGAGAQEALPPFEEWAQEAGRLKSEIESATISITAHKNEVAGAAQASDQAATAADKASTATGQVAQQTDAAASAIERQGENTSAAADSMEALAGSGESAASSQEAVAAASDKAASATTAAAQGADALKASLDAIESVSFDALLSGLNAVQQKLLETAAVAEQVGSRIDAALAVDTDAGASPIGPVPSHETN